MSFIPVPFDPKVVFGKVRAPEALKAAPRAWERWQDLSFTHQREYVESIEEARKPETRARRIENAVRMVGARSARRPK